MSSTTQGLSARDTILKAVRANLPTPAVALPHAVSSLGTQAMSGGVGYHGQITHLEQVDGFPDPGQSLVPFFQKQLVAMGGCSYMVGDMHEAEQKILELFPDVKVRCSTVPEIAGTRRLQPTDEPGSLADVELAVVRSRLGVAEAAALWLSSEDLIVSSLGVLTQHLVVLLDPKDIVPTLHEAYGGMLDITASPYGVFMAGPSATGDIEGVIIHGAQGARSLTVLLLQ